MNKKKSLKIPMG